MRALRHAARLDYDMIRPRPVFTLPALSVTVEEEIEALRLVAGSKAVELICEQPDPFVQYFVSSWPKAFDTHWALSLGFTADESFEEIIRIYIDDELDGRFDTGLSARNASDRVRMVAEAQSHTQHRNEILAHTPPGRHRPGRLLLP